MVIHTYSHEYPVSYVKEISEVSESYICRNTEMGGMCRILAINDKSLFPGIVPGLSDADSNNAFTDFIEHFIFEGVLCIVMKYTQGITLKDRIETERFTLAEKLELGRRVLERMILQELPDYYLAKCCDEKNIMVDSDMTVNFNYNIEDIGNAQAYSHEGAMSKVSNLIRFMFAKEAEDYSSAEISQFLARLPEIAGKGDLIGLYSEYLEMMQRATSSEAKSAEEKSVWHILWEKLKKLGVSLRKVLMVLLLLAAALYLIWSIGEANSTGTRYSNFERIGTVEIK